VSCADGILGKRGMVAHLYFAKLRLYYGKVHNDAHVVNCKYSEMNTSEALLATGALHFSDTIGPYRDRIWVVARNRSHEIVVLEPSTFSK